MAASEIKAIVDAIAPIGWPIIVLLLGLIFGPFVIHALTKVGRGKIGPLQWENNLREAAAQSTAAAAHAERSLGALDELSLLMAKTRVTELELVLQVHGFPGNSAQRETIQAQVRKLKELIARGEQATASRKT